MYSLRKWHRANIAFIIWLVYAANSAVNGVTFSDNNTIVMSLDRADEKTICQDGLLLSVWMPQENITLQDRVIRGAVYFSILTYLFFGVSIVSDRFMAGTIFSLILCIFPLTNLNMSSVSHPDFFSFFFSGSFSSAFF